MIQDPTVNIISKQIESSTFCNEIQILRSHNYKFRFNGNHDSSKGLV